MREKPEPVVNVYRSNFLARASAVASTVVSTSPVTTTTIRFGPQWEVTSTPSRREIPKDVSAPAVELTRSQRSTDLIPTFKLFFWIILGLTLSAAIYAGILANGDEPHGAKKELFDWCLRVAWAGFFALLGLIGGKAA